MILLLVLSNDFTVHEILNWLNYMKKKYIVINELNYITDTKILIDGEICLTLRDGNSFKLSDINSVFIRRGRFWFKNNLPYLYVEEKDLDKKDKNKIDTDIAKFIKNELKTLEQYLMRVIKDKITYIGDYNEGENNKLTTLRIANQVGLKIPKTFITCNKKNVGISEKLITKAIKEGFNITVGDTMFKLKTHLVLDKLVPQEFSPSLFQDKIDKKFELRIFFVKNKFYSMAIFSQQNQRTQIDFRNYDYNKPTKTSPYKLPPYLQSKLKRLMKVLDLTSGSIDMIYTTNNEYVFLEVNPTGQFGMVSNPCN